MLLLRESELGRLETSKVVAGSKPEVLVEKTLCSSSILDLKFSEGKYLFVICEQVEMYLFTNNGGSYFNVSADNPRM